MHIADSKGKRVTLKPGDTIAFRKVDSSITLYRNEDTLKFKIGRKGFNPYNSSCVLNPSGNQPVDPCSLITLICCLLGLSYELIHQNEEYMSFKLIKETDV